MKQSAKADRRLGDEAAARRRALLSLVALGTGPLLSIACKPKAAPARAASLDPAARSSREQLGYTEAARDAGKPCETCRFYVPPPRANICGGCSVLPGSVNASGSCNVWNPRS